MYMHQMYIRYIHILVIFFDVFLYVDATVPLHININSRTKYLKLLFVFIFINLL